MSHLSKTLLNKYSYLKSSNPHTTIDSVASLLNDHLSLTEDTNFAVLNKPPGFVLLDIKKKDINGLSEVLKQNVKKKFQWVNALKIPLANNDQSGISLFAATRESFNSANTTMQSTFSSNHINFLKFYGITTYIPLRPKGKEVFHVSYKNVGGEVLYFEEKEASINQRKSNRIITYQIEHDTLSYNESLNVALVKFETTMHSGEGINVYCIKNLCPLLGDAKYPSRIQTVFNRPVLKPDEDKIIKPGPQTLSKSLLERLDLEKNEKIPLHLHLHEINLEKKFKKQKVVIKHKAPLLEYFKETLKRLNLKLPSE